MPLPRDDGLPQLFTYAENQFPGEVEKVPSRESNRFVANLIGKSHNFRAPRVPRYYVQDLQLESERMSQEIRLVGFCCCC